MAGPRSGRNLIDVAAYPFTTDVDSLLAELPLAGRGEYDRHFRIGGVKILIDGSSQGKTAAFTTLRTLRAGPAARRTGGAS